MTGPPSAGGPALLCDDMLGTLARWLRLLGFDTAYPGASLEDDALLRLAREGDRTLLTRDRDLAATRRVRTLYVQSDILDEQVVQVLRDLALEVRAPMTRCSVCNGELVSASREEVEGQVPAGVHRRHRTFWRCPGCARVYWRGSHWERIEGKIEEYRAAAASSKT